MRTFLTLSPIGFCLVSFVLWGYLQQSIKKMESTFKIMAIKTILSEFRFFPAKSSDRKLTFDNSKSNYRAIQKKEAEKPVNA